MKWTETVWFADKKYDLLHIHRKQKMGTKRYKKAFSFCTWFTFCIVLWLMVTLRERKVAGLCHLFFSITIIFLSCIFTIQEIRWKLVVNSVIIFQLSRSTIKQPCWDFSFVWTTLYSLQHVYLNFDNIANMWGFQIEIHLIFVIV